MKKLNSLDDYKKLRESLTAGRNDGIPTIVIPAGTCGRASGADDLIRTAEKEILAKRLEEKVRLRVTGCHGFCQMEPSVLIEPSRTFYPRVTPDVMVRIIDAVSSGEVLRDALFKEEKSGKFIEKQDDIPFFKNQMRSILAGNERVDPTRIFDCIETGGYSAVVRMLEKNDPKWVLDEVVKSGLRGRGGAGFPTGRKWEMLASRPANKGKFLICNADEGDPGAYMDRSVLEGNPHSIIEGMIVGAFATGATEGIIYVRSEYPLAIRHLVVALKQARELGLLGRNILGKDFSFDITVVKGAGAFVCGEETALIRSIEGKTGEPRQRPPYPIEKGINKKPTSINNVETWANIPIIINNGSSDFIKIGVKNNSGTKIFSLVGKVKYTGLVEVPMGISINDIIYNIGGGPVNNIKIKAVQTGGPSGGCIPSELFHLPIDYESLAKVGSIMGSGGMIVMDDNTCMIDVAKYFMNFLKSESCGKCFTCRKGTQRMHEILDDISQGTGTPGHISLLEELATVVKETTMCALGQSASNPVLSTLRYFRAEYEHHINDKKCDAFVCKELVGAPCQTACPVDTEPWRYIALIEKGEYEEAYKVIREANPFPSVCARSCDRKCENRCNLGTTGGESIAIRALKRFVTDHVDPSVYKPTIGKMNGRNSHKIAVVGAGPAGLTAAHYLSLLGYKVTVFDAEDEPGGMLVCSLPAYRLPRDIVRGEIKSLLNENITIKCGTALGRDMTIEKLFADEFKAVFLAIGAHESWRLDLEGEDLEGVYPSIEFLKAFNLKGEELAHGHVGIVGGGNSAVDAARVALRQKKVESVTLFYRRTRDEMPAYEEEVEAALEEGVRIETLVSPVKLHVRQEEIEAAIKEGIELETLVTPVKIFSQEGHVNGIECIRNKLGEVDASGRRKPVPVPGTEFRVSIDTLIVAIGERPCSRYFESMGLEVDGNGRLGADPETLATKKPGVFAGGDLVTGPNTVIDAISAGKKAARMIDRYLQGKALKVRPEPKLPRIFIEPSEMMGEETGSIGRATPPVLPVEKRVKNFAEVEKALTKDQARREAQRCLRCDLAFTRKADTAIVEDALTGGRKS